MRTRKLSRNKASIYWTKARRFRSAAMRNLEERNWDPAVSAAVHAAISAMDALCVRYAGQRSASQDHEEAVLLMLSIRDLDGQELKKVADRVNGLVRQKHLAEYEERLCGEEDATSAWLSLDRAWRSFDTWLSSPSTSGS